MAKRGISVGVEITGNAKSYKSAAEDAAKATAKLERESRERSRQIEQNFKMASIAVAKIGAAVLVAKAAWDVYAKVMGTTEGSADKLDQQMAVLKGSVQGVMFTLFSGDWANLISNIKETAAATKELAIANDQLEEAMARNKVTRGDLEIMLESAKLSAAEETDKGRKKSLLEEAIGYQKQITALNKSEIQTRIDAQLEYYKKLIGAGDSYWNYVKANLVSVVENYDLFYSNIREYQALYARAQGVEKERLHNLLMLLEDYSRMQADLSKKGQWEAFLANIGALRSEAANGEQALLRLTKQVTALGIALDKTNITRVQGITPISGLIPSISGLSQSPGLRGAPQMDYLRQTNEGLITQMELVGELENSFRELFYNTGEGFKGMVSSFINSIEILVAELAAKAVILAILKIITGGIAPASLTNLKIPSLAPSLPGLQGAPKSAIGAMNLNVVGSIKGRDIALTLRRNGA